MKQDELVVIRRSLSVARNEEIDRTYDVRRRVIKDRYGVPECMQKIVGHLVRMSKQERETALKALVQVDFDALAAELESVQEDHFNSLIFVCNSCDNTFRNDQLRHWGGPGVGTFCLPCHEIMMERHRRRLSRRSVRSALRRAQAAGLPATLSDCEWRLTVEHFEGSCAYCGQPPWYVVEHVTSIELGGSTTKDNCVPACFSCNSRKSKTTMRELFVKPFLGLDVERLRKILNWLAQQGRDISIDLPPSVQ